MTSPALTLLYVPGDRSERVTKALQSRADVVAVDLEDAVVAGKKAEAREVAAQLLAEVHQPVQVRINAAGTPWQAEDLEMVRGLPAAVGVRCPKIESAQQVRNLAEALPGRALHLLVESALGVELAFTVATAAPQVATLGLGEADLRSDLRVADDSGLTWARSRLITAARAAGLPAPMMSVYPDLKDSTGLRASCLAGRNLGFLGRAAIHPGQLAVIREAFLPTPEEVQRARRVLDALSAGEETGAGVFVLADGSFVDRAMAENARSVLFLAATASN